MAIAAASANYFFSTNASCAIYLKCDSAGAYHVIVDVASFFFFFCIRLASRFLDWRM
jgi:hypothetical protein